MSVDELKDVHTLYHTHNLSHLSYECLLLGDEVLVSIPPIILPRLVMVSIHVVDIRVAGHISVFLQMLSAPSLEILFLRDVPEDAVSDPLPPAKFPALRYLIISFDYAIGSTSPIVKLAVGFTYITHLTYTDDLAFLSAILVASEVDSKGVFVPMNWPNLHTLSLPKFVTGYMAGEKALQMVLSRKDAGGCPQTLRVNMTDASVISRGIWQTVNNYVEVVGIYTDNIREVSPSSWDRWGVIYECRWRTSLGVYRIITLCRTPVAQITYDKRRRATTMVAPLWPSALNSRPKFAE